MSDDKIPLTAAEIAELRRLEAAATPGEWEAVGTKVFGLDAIVSRSMDHPRHYICSIPRVKGTSGPPANPDQEANALIIAALRNAAPRLLAAAEREGRLREFCQAVCPSLDPTLVAYDKSMGEMFAKLAAKDRTRMARRIVQLETALQDLRPYIGHHEKCPGWGNDRGASCNCGGQNGYAILDAALAETEVQK